MREVTINTNQILLDKAMNKYLTENCNFTNSSLKSFGLKPLPIRLDKAVGYLKPDKIENIKKAYESNSQSSLPLPDVNKISDSYYSVVDGRHRIVLAICNGVPKINVKVLNLQKTQNNEPKKSRSKSKNKSRSRSNSSSGTKKNKKNSRSRSRSRSSSKKR
jgi:hypothetical protein